jgi:hypothetical protein
MSIFNKYFFIKVRSQIYVLKGPYPVLNDLLYEYGGIDTYHHPTRSATDLILLKHKKMA